MDIDIDSDDAEEFTEDEDERDEEEFTEDENEGNAEEDTEEDDSEDEGDEEEDTEEDDSEDEEEQYFSRGTHIRVWNAYISSGVKEARYPGTFSLDSSSFICFSSEVSLSQWSSVWSLPDMALHFIKKKK